MLPDDLVQAYVGLREEARELHVRIGWPPEEFDREVPEWNEDPAVAARRIGQAAGTGNPRELLERSARARLYLRQLTAAIAGDVKAIEFDRKIEVELRANAEAAAKPSVGFE